MLHLYYARFISHFLHSLGLLPEREPFKRLLVQGMVMGRSFRIKGTGEYLPEDKVKLLGRPYPDHGNKISLLTSDSFWFVQI